MAKEINKELINEIASRVQALRKQKGYTLEELAFEADMELTQVHRVVSAQNEPQVSTLIKLCKALDTDISTLLKGL